MTHSRRKALKAGLALAFATPAVAISAAEPDAELIALCRQIDALETSLNLRGEQVDAHDSPGEREFNQFVDVVRRQQWELAHRICALPCVPPAVVETPC